MSEEYVIDDGIDVPARGRDYGKITRTLMKMQVGQSFYCAGKKTRQVGSYLASAKKMTGFSFVSRKENDGCRIWRLS